MRRCQSGSSDALDDPPSTLHRSNAALRSSNSTPSSAQFGFHTTHTIHTAPLTISENQSRSSSSSPSFATEQRKRPPHHQNRSRSPDQRLDRNLPSSRNHPTQSESRNQRSSSSHHHIANDQSSSDASSFSKTIIDTPFPRSRLTLSPSSVTSDHNNNGNMFPSSWPSTSSSASASPSPSTAKSYFSFLSSSAPSSTPSTPPPTKSQSTTRSNHQRWKHRGPWSFSWLTMLVACLGLSLLGAILYSLVTRQTEPAGCRMSFMRPQYHRFTDFDTEHTLLATKYSLYLYREGGIDDARNIRLRGTPVLFIPGNAGSFKQVRPIAAEAAHYFRTTLQHNPFALESGVRPLDFFTVDFNEDFTAFHGQTLMDQADYLNEAVRYILSLYMDPAYHARDNSSLPDPTSIIILGHSMGGVVARTMLIMPNYQPNSINTILTLSAPHSRPPVSFDSDIVSIYNEINSYWRWAYSQQWASDNPLWHTTLVSVASGGLDLIVPSDYSGIETLVPETHGFTVFATGIPHVWTSMDHQCILWCDQFRQVITRALYGIVDARRPTQTKPRAERMRVFRKWFLTGLESKADRSLPHLEPSLLLTVGSQGNQYIVPQEQLILSSLGPSHPPHLAFTPYLLPIPPVRSTGDPSRFTLLTNHQLDDGSSGIHGKKDAKNGGAVVEIYACKATEVPGTTPSAFALNIHLSGTNQQKDGSVPTQYACKNLAADTIPLPPSTTGRTAPFVGERQAAKENDMQSFSYLEYRLADLADYQYIAVLDKAQRPTSGFVVMEFRHEHTTHTVQEASVLQLLTSGVRMDIPSHSRMVSEIQIPAIQSSLLAYTLDLKHSECVPSSDGPPPNPDGHAQKTSGPKKVERQSPLFAPLVRQYLERPYESKFFANAHHIPLNVHGVSPYLPPSTVPAAADSGQGLRIQIWTDPSCPAFTSATDLQVRLKLDLFTSLGRLYIRYRTIFGAYPLFIVLLVLQKQFHLYDTTGIFPPFIDALHLCLRRSIPAMVGLLSTVWFFWRAGLQYTGRLYGTGMDIGTTNLGPVLRGGEAISSLAMDLGTGGGGGGSKVDGGSRVMTPSSFLSVDYEQNLALVGSFDSFAWILLPLISVVSLGVCYVGHYMVVLLTTVLAGAHRILRSSSPTVSLHFRTTPSPQRRLMVMGSLLVLVATMIPYQFAYLVVCLIQLLTTSRALGNLWEAPLTKKYNLYHCTHAILQLLLWVMPLNLPILVVWIRNLAVHWWTPFSSDHNVLSILGFMVLAESLSTGRMVPRMTSILGTVTSSLILFTGMFCALFGDSYAFKLHHLVHMIATWFVLLQFVHSGVFSKEYWSCDKCPGCPDQGHGHPRNPSMDDTSSGRRVVMQTVPVKVASPRHRGKIP